MIPEGGEVYDTKLEGGRHKKNAKKEGALETSEKFDDSASEAAKIHEIENI